MPYLPDGTFTPDQPITTSGAPMNALAQPLAQTPDGTPPQNPATTFVPFSKQTGMPRYTADRRAAGFDTPGGDVLKSIKIPKKPPASFAQMQVPSFLEYAQFAAKRDSTPDAAVDPSTMDDATYLRYAKEYGDTMLPQALMSAGHKVTPEYLKTLTPNFQYQTAQNLDKIREHFKGMKPPPDPNAPQPEAPTSGYDWLKQLGAKATEIGSQALAGTVRTLSDPRVLLGPMGRPIAALASQLSPKAHKFLDQMDKNRDAAINPIGKFGAATAKELESSESPGFQAKANQPFLHPDQPWVTPEGGLNPKKFNANSLNLPNLVGKGEDVMLPLIAIAATRDPAVAASAFGLQASEASRQGELERLGALTPEQWNTVPAYVHKVQEGLSPDQAKDQVITESARTQQMIGAASGTLTGLAGGLPWFKPAVGSLFSRILKNYAVQAPSFAALSGASTAASNIGKEAATGETINPLAGVGESAITGAVTAAPFALAGGKVPHEAPSNRPPTPEAGSPGDPGNKVNIGAGENTPVQSAVAYAMETVPPPKKPFATPAEAQNHYAQSLAAFKGDLRGADIPPEEIAGMVPAFDKAWSDATGFDPKTGMPVAAPGAAAPPAEPSADEIAAAAAKAPPDGSAPPPEAPSAAPEQPGLDLTGVEPGVPALDLGARPSVPEVAAAREAIAADHLPEGLRTRVAADLKENLGRDPTNSEIAKQAGHLMDIALDQNGIDKSIPRPALEEALGELMAKDKTFPDTDAINDLARKKAKNPNQEGMRFQDPLDFTLKGAESEGAKSSEESGQKPNNPLAGKKRGKVAERSGGKAGTAKERNAGRKAKGNVLKGKKAEPDALNNEASGGFELATKETAVGHPREGWMRQEASPEQQAKQLPVERFYKRFKNVHDLLTGLKDRIVNAPNLKALIERMLSNPYLREKLSGTNFSVHNPGDSRDVHTDQIGNYQKYTKLPNGLIEFTSRNVMGMFHPKKGVVVAGARWEPSNALDNGLNPVTVVHEAVHAGIAETIIQHEKDIKAGKPTNLVIRDAYDQLQEFREALKSQLDNIEASKDTKAALTYATTNIHELLSVVMTDPRVQRVLHNIKMGEVTAWKKLLNIISRFLGVHEGSEQTALEHVLEQGNKFIDYRPEDYVEPLHNEGQENLSEALFSARSDRIEQNTPERVMDAISIKPPKARIAEENRIAQEQNKPTKAGEWERKIFDKLKPLTQAKERLAALGKPVSPKEDIDAGARVYQNLAARATNIAQQQFIQPTIQKIVELAGKTGKTSDEFLTQLSAWYFGKRALEVNDRGDLEHARLRKDAEEQRQAIRDEWAKGNIPEGEYLQRLRAVVNAAGARVENRSPLNKSGITDETAHELISRAKRNGITQDIINEFDPYRQKMLEEIDRNYQRSGRFSTFDAARRKALGSRYYVPLKGFGEAGAGDEMGSSGLGAFTREYTGAQGRTTIAQNPILNLMQELQGSVRDVPENGLTRIVYDFARKYGKDFGIKIRTLDVESAIKDAIAAGGSVGDIDRSFKNPQTVIHNNGEYRYSMEFPEGSPILEALKSINETRELNTFERMAGNVTNLIARGATTLNPKFLLWNAFWRDTGYVGAQIGVDYGPAAMAEYAARYWLQGGPLRGRATYFRKGVIPRNALERDLYAATGKSKFAQSLAEIAKYGGDLSFENELNTVRNMDTAYEALRKASGENLTPAEKAKRLYDPLVHFLDQIGTSDIMTARVAAYETLISAGTKALGHAPSNAELVQIKKDAALYSRRILDYQQRSDLSRSLNVVFPFARVVMTQTDRLLQTFKKPDGSYDLKKVAIMTAVGLMAGATYYSLLRQAHKDVKKQENSTLAQNFVVPVGDGLIRVPMAYGLTRLFLVPGMMMARHAYGDSSGEDAANEVRNAIVEGFLPFKPPEAQHNEKFHDEIMDLVTAMTPGAMRPFLEIERNKNIFGSQITPMDDRTKGPHFEGGFNGTPELWKWGAKTLHDLTGGAVDVYPESLEYLTGAYGTGPGNAIMRAASIHSKGQSDVDVQKLPFVPSVTSRDAEFYERREIEHLKEDLESKGKEHQTDADKALLHEINSAQQKYGKQRAALYRDKVLSKAQRQKMLDQISTEQRRGQQELLRRVNHGK